MLRRVALRCVALLCVTSMSDAKGLDDEDEGMRVGGRQRTPEEAILGWKRDTEGSCSGAQFVPYGYLRHREVYLCKVLTQVPRYLCALNETATYLGIVLSFRLLIHLHCISSPKQTNLPSVTNPHIPPREGLLA